MRKNVLVTAALAFSLCAALLAFNTHDFDVLYSAATVVRQGGNPYAVPMFVSPLSVFVYFIPISLLPEMLAFRLTIFLSTLVYCVVIYRAARGNLPITILALASPLMLYNLFATNIDWLLALALLVNPIAGLFLALLKPQIGGALALVLLVLIGQRYGRRLAALCIVIQAVIYAASFIWHAQAASLESALSWTVNHAGNMSVFPFGAVIGLPLLVFALRRRDPLMALAAMPFLSPYVGPQSWIAVLPLAARSLSRLMSQVRADRLDDQRRGVVVIVDGSAVRRDRARVEIVRRL